MTGEQKRNIAIMGGAALLILYFLRPQNAGMPVTVQGDSVTVGDATGGDTTTNIKYEFGSPSVGGGWVPGDTDYHLVFGPGGQPFTVIGGDTNINVPDLLLGSLSRQYIPMFGFVGVTAVGAN